MDATELAKLYDTVLSIPGMNEPVKIELKLPRKNVLLLTKLIQRGLPGAKEKKGSLSILEGISPQSVTDLSELAKELLTKAGLMEMNEKLDSF